jgi:hypothetical protein
MLPFMALCVPLANFDTQWQASRYQPSCLSLDISLFRRLCLTFSVFCVSQVNATFYTLAKVMCQSYVVGIRCENLSLCLVVVRGNIVTGSRTKFKHIWLEELLEAWNCHRVIDAGNLWDEIPNSVLELPEIWNSLEPMAWVSFSKSSSNLQLWFSGRVIQNLVSCGSLFALVWNLGSERTSGYLLWGLSAGCLYSASCWVHFSRNNLRRTKWLIIYAKADAEVNKQSVKEIRHIPTS